jgi:hypothetical protein
LAEYKTIKEQQGFSVIGQDLGLIVNPSFPYLAASPDWFTELKNGNQAECGLVEVKSLSKYANLKPCEAAEFCDFLPMKMESCILTPAIPITTKFKDRWQFLE